MAGTTYEQLKNQAERLSKQLEKLQADSTKLDPDGTPSAEAFSAQKNMPTLETEYRLVLTSLAGIESKSGTTPANLHFFSQGGNTYAYDPDTKTTTKILDTESAYLPKDTGGSGIPNGLEPGAIPNPDYQSPKSADPTVRKGADGRDYQWNATTGTWDLAMPDVDKAIADAKAKMQAEHDRLIKGLADGTISPAEAAASSDQSVQDYLTFVQKQQAAKTQADQFQQSQARLAAQDTQQAAQYQQTEGRLSSSDAFDQSYKAEDLGQTAGVNAVNRVLDSLKYAVGPNFGANFAAGLNTLSRGGGPVNFGAGDFTYQMPNLDAIARQATAQALAHISPHAASIVGAPMPTAPAAASVPQALAQIPPYVAPTAPYVPRQPVTNPNLLNPGG